MLNHKCKDHYINADDGSLDKICTVCGLRAMQAAMCMSQPNEASQNPFLSNAPIKRETVTIHTGNLLGNVDIYKDELIEKIKKDMERQIEGRIGRW